MSDTPITDKIITDADATPETRVVFLIKHLANQCKTFERENFALAANQCLHGIKGDEGGTPYCPRIVELERALKDLLEQVESLDSYGLTRDTETYKAQACWDDAIYRASQALKRAPAWQPHPAPKETA